MMAGVKKWIVPWLPWSALCLALAILTSDMPWWRYALLLVCISIYADFFREKKGRWR